MKRDRPEQRQGAPSGGGNRPEEAAMLEEIRQLRATIHIYRDLVQRLLRERKAKE